MSSTAFPRRAAQLRVIATPAPPPLPDLGPLLAARPRRPGDRHELVELPPRVAATVERAAAAYGLSADVALTLLAEAAWLQQQLENLGGYGLVRALDEHAQALLRVERALSAAEADYLRTLVMSQRRSVKASPRQRAAVPVRLLGRVDPDVLIATDEALARSVSWEAAAVLARMSMSEWGLREALAISCPRRPIAG